jgi:epoxyqueuosine reductase QueG
VSVVVPSDTALGEAIVDFIREWLEPAENNNLGYGATGKAWENVLVGFSNGADQVWQDFKRHVAPFHWTPAEAFALGTHAGGTASTSEDASSDRLGQGVPDVSQLTVVSWSLQQSEAARLGNRHQRKYPGEAWARTRRFGQECNVRLHRALLAALHAAGYQAVAPALLPAWVQQMSPEHGLASSWSERHVAYASGLGTFGLNGGLITAHGQAHRLGSIIVQAAIPPTPHAYQGPFDYCLFLSQGICGRCVARCPVGSVSEGGRDKEACARHLGPAVRRYIETEYGFEGYACGLCQTAVPCEAGIPQRSQTVR